MKAGEDGVFWMEDFEALEIFVYLQVAEIRDGWVFSMYDKRGDKGTLNKFTFTLNETTPMYIQVELYNPRMYAQGCKNYTHASEADITLRDNAT